MTGEATGFTMEILLENGALDVFCIQIGMKKSRPGMTHCCLYKCEDTKMLAGIMLHHKTSLGVQITHFQRITLEQKIETAETL